MHAELLLRILVGTALGSVIGYERDVHGRPAGLRTHALVALAASTFMVVSTRFVFFQGYSREDLVAVDTSRIAASVVTGIGFLAGGAILRTGLTVQGLTTAAGLWLVAAIGLAAGGGMYVVSGFSTVVGITALTLLRRLEDKDERTSVRRRLTLDLAGDAPPLAALVARLASLDARVSEESYERDPDGAHRVSLDVRLPFSVSSERMLAALESEAGVRRVRIERV